MNRQEFAQTVVRMGVPVTSYSLFGGLPDEKYVLSVEDDAWWVYFADGARRLDEQRFDTEHEACEELLLRLTRDPLARRPWVGSEATNTR